MIKVFDDVLNPEELSSLSEGLNLYKNYVVCPHTDRMLEANFFKDSLNNIRPRAQCLKPSAGHDDLKYNANLKKIVDTLNEREKMHDSAHIGQWITKKHFPKAMDTLISKCPVELKGVEWWSYDSINVGSDKTIAVPMHVDYDGGLEMLTGEIVCPEVTYVFYDEVEEGLEGGELILYDTDKKTVLQKIEPKRNRLIVFSGGLPHEVLRFVGRRRSFIFLPWKERPREFI